MATWKIVRVDSRNKPVEILDENFEYHSKPQEGNNISVKEGTYVVLADSWMRGILTALSMHDARTVYVRNLPPQHRHADGWSMNDDDELADIGPE